MFSANGKQQTAGLNCTAKFPRATAHILSLTRPSLSVSLSGSATGFSCRFSLLPLCASVCLSSTKPHGAARGGGCCGVACVCKSCVRGCGTSASREYVCARVRHTQRLHTYIQRTSAMHQARERERGREQLSVVFHAFCYQLAVHIDDSVCGLYWK